MFEKGEDVSAVAGLLQGFVAPAMVRGWHERYCSMHGVSGAEISKNKIKRMPMPPIDFSKIKVEDLEALTEKELEREMSDADEPDW